MANVSTSRSTWPSSAASAAWPNSRAVANAFSTISYQAESLIHATRDEGVRPLRDPGYVRAVDVHPERRLAPTMPSLARELEVWSLERGERIARIPFVILEDTDKTVIREKLHFAPDAGFVYWLIHWGGCLG